MRSIPCMTGVALPIQAALTLRTLPSWTAIVLRASTALSDRRAERMVDLWDALAQLWLHRHDSWQWRPVDDGQRWRWALQLALSASFLTEKLQRIEILPLWVQHFIITRGPSPIEL